MKKYELAYGPPLDKLLVIKRGLFSVLRVMYKRIPIPTFRFER